VSFILVDKEMKSFMILIDKKLTRRVLKFQLGIQTKKSVFYLFGFCFGYEKDIAYFEPKDIFYFRIYLPTLLKGGRSANYIGI